MHQMMCEGCGSSKVRPTCLNLKRCVITLDRVLMITDVALVCTGKINTHFHHPFPEFFTLCHAVPARPTGPDLQLFDG